MSFKRFTHIIYVMLLLLICGVGEVWSQVTAITANDILIQVMPSGKEGKGSVTDATYGSVSASVGTLAGPENNQYYPVTLTVTPKSGYQTKTALITAEKMIAPNELPDRRAPRTGTLTVTGPGSDDSWKVGDGTTGYDYTFNVPSDFHGAYVTVTFVEILSGENPPTQISTLLELLQGISSNSSGSYILTHDIDASGLTASISEFSGILDGNYHKIINLDKPLFTTLNGAVVRNINLQDVRISQDGPVGAIAGTASGYSRIYNCGILPSGNKYVAEYEPSYLQSTGNTSGNTDSYCGGLVGWLKDDSRVINCFSYANITGGTDVAGIVGHNEAGSTTAVTTVEGKDYYSNLRTAVVNCMFYGNITGGTNRWPVYGGAKMVNNTATGINNYDFYRAEASVVQDDEHYNCSFPAKEEYLTQYDYYRYLLNSNRELCGWWVGAPSAPSTMETAYVQKVTKDASLIAKWVLDPSIAPYPILKPAGYYSSIINKSPRPDETNPQRINPETKQWVSRASYTNTTMTDPKKAPETEGESLGKIKVTIKKNSSDTGTDKDIIITAMDIDNNDFCYGKIQLPYYNSIFGNPTIKIDAATPAERATQWNRRYGGNYGDNVVVGWDISVESTQGVTNITNIKKEESGQVIYDHTYSTNSQSGYNFADRYCTTKDQNRTFAQGGYYYVPYGVSEITITAKWAAAKYLDNTDHYYDCVSVSNYVLATDLKQYVGSSTLHPFTPAGTRSTTLDNGKAVETGSIRSNLLSGDVYENAIVLVGNHQSFIGDASIGGASNGCTIISADFDLDDEPDNCLIWDIIFAPFVLISCPSWKWAWL